MKPFYQFEPNLCVALKLIFALNFLLLNFCYICFNYCYFSVPFPRGMMLFWSNFKSTMIRGKNSLMSRDASSQRLPKKTLILSGGRKKFGEYEKGNRRNRREQWKLYGARKTHLAADSTVGMFPFVLLHVSHFLTISVHLHFRKSFKAVCFQP